MKKSVTKIMKATIAVAMAIGAGVGASLSDPKVNSALADEESAYTITFANNANSAAGISASTNASTTIASGSRTYVNSQPYTVDSGNNYYGGPTDAEKASIRIGKSGNSAGLSIALSNNGKVKATKFVVNCMVMTGSKNTGGTLSVNGMDAQTAPTSADDLTFTFASATDITSISLESSKAVFVYSIEVYRYKAPSKTLTSIALSGTYPTSFTQGDAFSHSGMTVTATYNDASTANVTTNATFTGYDMSASGAQTVTVSYTENAVTKTATYGITVAAATMYTIGGTIANGSLSDTASVREGNELNINIVAETNYSLPDTLDGVTMGGNALTLGDDYLYDSNDGAFYIEHVTGNVVINATCSKTAGQWEDAPYTIAQAKAAIDAGVGVNNVYVGGIISQVDSYNETHHSITYWISSDGTKTNQFQVYGGLGLNGANFNSADDIDVGATVVIYGNIKKYYSTYEFDSDNQQKSYVAPTTRQAIEGKNTFSSLTYRYSRSGDFETDVLNVSFTGITGTDYQDWSGKHGNNSTAVYAGQSSESGGIQLRTKNSNSGIITTTSGGQVSKVTVSWNSGTAAGRILEVYGKTTAYAAASDLFDNNLKGTKLGTIVYGTSTELEIGAGYTYIGLRSNSNALILDSIEIEWANDVSYSFSNAAIRFGAAIRTSLWNELDGLSNNIQGFGVIISYDNLGASTIKDKYLAKKTNENTVEQAIDAVFDQDGEGADTGDYAGKNFYKGVDQKAEGHPDAADTTQKAELGLVGDYYIWYLNKNVTGNLTATFTAVAYIRTADDIVFLQEAKESAKSIASRMVSSLGAGYAGGSLENLANLA